MHLETKEAAGCLYEARVMQVIRNRRGKIIGSKPVTEWTSKKHNLILPAQITGLVNWQSLFNSCAAGSGNTAAKVLLDGTFSQAGTAITRVSGSGTFISGNANDFVKFGTGQIAKINSYTDSTNVVADRSQTVAATTLTVYDTSRSLLDTWVKRSNTLSGDVGASGTTNDTDLGTTTHFETYDFTVEVAPASYQEIGMAGANTNSSIPLWSRVVLDSPVAVDIDQFLQVRCTLILTMTNYRTSTAITITPTGWPRPYSITSITPSGTYWDVLCSEVVSGHYAVGRPIIIAGALPATVAISSISSTVTHITVNTSTAHGRTAGDSIVLAGVTPSGYNGTYTIDTVTDSDTYVIASVLNLGAGSGGTSRLATPGTWYNGTHTIASFPTSSTIRITNATSPAVAGAAGTVTNSTAAVAIVTGYHTQQFTNSAHGGILDFKLNTTKTLALYTEAQMQTGMTYGILTSAGSPITTGTSYDATGSTYDAANRERTMKFIIPSASGNSQQIRQMRFNADSGNLIVTFDERQRKDTGYQLTVTMKNSWEPTLD